MLLWWASSFPFRPDTSQGDVPHQQIEDIHTGIHSVLSLPLHTWRIFSTKCRIHLHPVQEVTEVVQVVHFYRGTRERLGDQLRVNSLDDYVVIQVLSRDMLKEIRDKDGDKIQGILDVSELVSFLFSPPYISTMFCQWPINEIRICEPTRFHAAGLPLDDQPGSSRAAPQTPNPAPHVEHV